MRIFRAPVRARPAGGGRHAFGYGARREDGHHSLFSGYALTGDATAVKSTVAMNGGRS